MVTQTSDPMDTAMSAEYQPNNTYFGQVNLDVWHCVLEKGQGKIPFDPHIHPQDRCCTAIDIQISPLPTARAQYVTERNMIAESKEWTKFTKPSLQAIGTDLRAIKDRWIQFQLVLTGETYPNKQGETKQKTAIKFLAVYNSEDECASAVNAYFASRRGSRSEAEATAPTTETAANSPERETAKKFLAPLWTASGKNIQKFVEMLEKNNLNQHFTLDSPEVIAVMMA